MFDTSMYSQGQGGLRSGFDSGQNMVHGADNDKLISEALQEIQAGADKNQVIAKFQTEHPMVADKLKSLLGMSSGGNAGMMQSIGSAAMKMFGG